MKSPAFVPVIAMLLMVSAPEPLFETVTVCAALVVFRFCVEKVRLLAERVTAGTTPVPLRATVCGLPAALSVIDTDAERVPEVVGSKVTLIEQ